MSLTGKILAILNVLAAVAFFYLAILDYAARAPWIYAAYRHDLVLDGLPVETRQRDLLQDIPEQDKLGENTPQQLLGAYGGGNIFSQEREVERVRDQLKSELAGLTGDAKRKRLAELLQALAGTGAERDLAASRCANPTISEDELTADLIKKFDDVLENRFAPDPESGDEVKNAPLRKRRAIADLLFPLAADETAHLRLQVIVGLRAYVEAVGRQADRLATMADRVRQHVRSERADFAIQHVRLVEAIEVLAATINDRKIMLAEENALIGRHELLVAQRKEEIEKVKENLAAAVKKTREALAAQAVEEQKTFEAQRVLSDIVHKNEELERRIRLLEGLDVK